MLYPHFRRWSSPQRRSIATNNSCRRDRRRRPSVYPNGSPAKRDLEAEMKHVSAIRRTAWQMRFLCVCFWAAAFGADTTIDGLNLGVEEFNMLWRRCFGSLHHDSTWGCGGIPESLRGGNGHYDAVWRPVSTRDNHHKHFRIILDRSYYDAPDGAVQAASQLAFLIGDRISGRLHDLL